MNAIVYIATNLINGKTYIGTTRKSLKHRVRGHKANANQGLKARFPRAVKKYGIEMFRFRILKICASLEEAFSEELRLIKVLSPEYNSHRGNGPYVRTPWSEETRARARKRALERDPSVWNKYRQMGPKAFSKKVRCLDDGLVFESASAAGRHYGTAKSSIIELCLKRPHRKTAGGRVFEYVAA